MSLFEGIDEIDLIDFFKPVQIPKERIGNTISLDEAVQIFYTDQYNQDIFLKYIFSFISFKLPVLKNILITFVAGDGKCLIYSFISHLKVIGTFSVSFHEIGFNEEDMNDQNIQQQYKDIVNQLIEEKCVNLRDDSVNFYNETILGIYPYLPIVDDNTNVCSPHILLYLSMIYSTVIIIIHYEDGVTNPTIVNGTIDSNTDYCFILCKGAHSYGLHIPTKDIRKDIYNHIIDNHTCTFLKMNVNRYYP
jgi:hypothetical protein